MACKQPYIALQHGIGQITVRYSSPELEDSDLLSTMVAWVLLWGMKLAKQRVSLVDLPVIEDLHKVHFRSLECRRLNMMA